MVIKTEALNSENDFGISFAGHSRKCFLDTVPALASLCVCNSIQGFIIIDGMRTRGQRGTGRDWFTHIDQDRYGRELVRCTHGVVRKQLHWIGLSLLIKLYIEEAFLLWQHFLSLCNDSWEQQNLFIMKYRSSYRATSDSYGVYHHARVHCSLLNHTNIHPG